MTRKKLDRRAFLRRLAQASGGVTLAPSLSGLAAWSWMSPAAARDGAGRSMQQQAGYGPLVPSATCPEFEIPEGFTCQKISVARAPSSVRSSLIVPNAFDGMAAFPLPNGNIRLIRNHEMVDTAARARPIGTPHYDAKGSGGTTSLEVRITGSGANLRVELVDEFVSLAGTRVNCAGGATPWGSWLSCEEICTGTAQGYDKPHGYIFEVPASATGPVDPVPLRAMGRFVHEAVAVDPNTGYVYETEDAWYSPTNPRQPGAGFYRFVPLRRGELAAGGRLQVMTVPGQRNYLTARGMQPGTTVRASWLDIENPDMPAAETEPSALFRESLAMGCAIFARLEGAFWGDNGIYVVSTNGGDATAGQVFHYRPTSESEGELTLIFASPSRDVLDGPDNVCLAPGGGVVMCEDGGGEQYIRTLDRAGNIANLVRHPVVAGRPGPGEFAGSCFSPDGRVMFFNVQGGRDAGATVASATYAMWGPWRKA
jgi:secreted PhoX family phosphatase